MPCVMNAANEIAVHAFLNDKISYLDIAIIIKKMMDDHNLIKNPNLQEILEVDRKVKEETKKVIENGEFNRQKS